GRAQLRGRARQRRLAGQREGTHLLRIGRQIGGGERHDRPYQGQVPATTISRESLPCQTSIGWRGAGGATVRRQSIASISSASCAGVRPTAPSTIGGHTKRPFSSRLANRQSPLPSQYHAFR